MIKLVNGVPERLVEMDEKVKFLQQVAQEVGPVTLINKFNVDPEEVDVGDIKCDLTGHSQEPGKKTTGDPT